MSFPATTPTGMMGYGMVSGSVDLYLEHEIVVSV